MTDESKHDQGLFTGLFGDGRSLLSLTAIALILSGGFALFLSASGSFLPHDVAFLGMSPTSLCAINECRIVHFMLHDRFSFGGVLIALGLLYLWLVAFPLREKEAWAWWVLAASGLSGFGSFLSYLGYGYLDFWHGIATLFLLPIFGLGMWLTKPVMRSWRTLKEPGADMNIRSCSGSGRLCLLLTGMGMILGGGTIMLVGMSIVFVPQDIAFIGLNPERLREINPQLVPLIAHDRAGFGGGLMSCGFVVLLIVWKAHPSRHLWQVLLCAGIAGFGCAIGVHYPIGYLDVTHLAPAWMGAIIFSLGMGLSYKEMHRARSPGVTKVGTQING